MPITNASVAAHPFLKGMYADRYFPRFLVDKGKAILLRLCERIEEDRHKGAEGVYVLTHAATEEFNDLAEEFGEHGSDIETAARECIALDFDFLLKAYGYEVDLEEAIAPRDW